MHPNTPRRRCDPGNVRNADDPERFGRVLRYGAVLGLALWLLIAWGIVVLWRLVH
jgi:hypothetical protein